MDVLIVGAGISGIGMAAHMGMACPDRSYLIAERRARLGGTWDLFRYPGVRSDSDMYTLGFGFEPWQADTSIASGAAILSYLDQIAQKHEILSHINFETKVIAADFRSEEARWHVTLEGSSGRRQMTAAFLYLAAGYYDYDTPHDPQIEGTEHFAGPLVHPQFWPEKLDISGKKIVVVGSGATAVSLVPALAQGAAHVTMLQRTPTWMGAMPAREKLAVWLKKCLPITFASRIIRAKNVRLQEFIFKFSRRNPAKMGRFLTRQTRKALGSHYSDKNWLPPYGPWQQRLCLVPDGDLFDAIKQGKVALVTDQIAHCDQSGIALASGRHLPADIIVTATGLKLTIAGGVAVSVDGVRVKWRKHFYYRSAMFSNVPNLGVVFGYLNASWTLRADLTAAYICQVLGRMSETGCEIVTPKLAENHGLEEADVYEFSSGYIQRARALMPKSAKYLPWRLNQDYREDCRDFRRNPVNDGHLVFETTANNSEKGPAHQKP